MSGGGSAAGLEGRVSGAPATAGDARSGPHVLVADVDAPALVGEDRHHLERVLRLRPGDPLTVGDGAGRWRTCRFGEEIETVGRVVATAAPSPVVAVGFAVLKGGRSEAAVRKLTELGIDRIVPFVAERSVVRGDAADLARRRERWRRVAREAVMQCRRLWVPEVEPVRAFGELDLGGAALAVSDGRTLADGENFLLVGPEGGWSGAELASVDRHVCLGPHIMRAETAAVAAAVFLGARRGGRLPSAGVAGGN